MIGFHSLPVLSASEWAQSVEQPCVQLTGTQGLSRLGRAEPGRAGPGRAEPSRAEPSRAVQLGLLLCQRVSSEVSKQSRSLLPRILHNKNTPLLHLQSWFEDVDNDWVPIYHISRCVTSGVWCCVHPSADMRDIQGSRSPTRRLFSLNIYLVYFAH